VATRYKAQQRALSPEYCSCTWHAFTWSCSCTIALSSVMVQKTLMVQLTWMRYIHLSRPVGHSPDVDAAGSAVLQVAGMMGPAVCLFAAASPFVHSPYVATGLITLGMGLSALTCSESLCLMWHPAPSPISFAAHARR